MERSERNSNTAALGICVMEVTFSATRYISLSYGHYENQKLSCTLLESNGSKDIVDSKNKRNGACSQRQRKCYLASRFCEVSSSGSQSGPRPATAACPTNLWKVNLLQPHSAPTETAGSVFPPALRERPVGVDVQEPKGSRYWNSNKWQ